MLKFGFIGLNDISEALCINLLKKVSSMAFVNDNSIARVEYLGNHGAVPCELASDVIERSDIVILNHDNFVDVQATIYSIMANLTPQKLILDLSVLSPDESLEIASTIKQTGADYADIAILNNFEEVESGQATILYGGSSSVFLKIKEYLEYIGKEALKIGGVSAAVTMKACYSILFTQIQNGVNEMLLFASKTGLVIDEAIAAIQASSAQNTFIKENGNKILSGNFSRKIDIKEIHKELQIASEHSAKLKMPLKGLEHVKNMYDSAMDRKLANHDITEIFTIVERASHSY